MTDRMVKTTEKFVKKKNKLGKSTFPNRSKRITVMMLCCITPEKARQEAQTKIVNNENSMWITMCKLVNMDKVSTAERRKTRTIK